MAYEPAGHDVLLYGGQNTTTLAILSDTWQFRNGDWTEVNASGPPPSLGSLAYDAADGYSVLFGGDYPKNDTWAFSNGTWKQLKPAHAPSARLFAPLVYDQAAGEVVFAGGSSAAPPYYNDTWAFHDGNWTQIHPLSAPPELTGSGFTYDGADSAYLLIGGSKPNGGPNVPGAWAWEAPNASISYSRPSVDLGQAFKVFGNATDLVEGMQYDWNGTSAFLGCGGSSVNGTTLTCLPSAAGQGNVSFNATDRDGAWMNISAMYTVYADPIVTNVTPSESPVEVGGATTIRVEAALGTGAYSGTNWTGLPPGNCTPTTNLSVECWVTTAGNYSIRAQVTDTNGVSSALSAPARLIVTPGPMARGAIASRLSGDVGQSVQFTAEPWGGSGSYVAYQWLGLSWAACQGLSGPVVNCTVAVPGNHTVSYDVTDSSGAISPVAPPLEFEAFPALGGPTVTAIPSQLDLGQSTLIVASVAAGDPPYALSWVGLPSGCAAYTTQSSTICRPTSSGTYRVTVNTTDGQGESAQASAEIVVAPALAISEVLLTPKVAGVGESFSLGVVATGGTGPYTYRYTGLPPGCLSQNSSTLICQPTVAGGYGIGINVTDAVHGWATSGVNLVIETPSGPPPSSGSWWPIGGAVALIASITGIVLIVWFRRRKT